MNIKSLLIGSAAATVAATGAQAADPIFVPEPEPMEYVRVCDVYGAGFFYIPGTETCLKIGGYVRYEIGARGDFDGLLDDGGWSKLARATLTVDARSETEYGTLGGFIEIRADSGGGSVTEFPFDFNGDTPFEFPGDINEGGALSHGITSGARVQQAIISLGGLSMGLSDTLYDAGLSGEFDEGGGDRAHFIRYTFDAANGFFATLALEEVDDSYDYAPNVVGNIGVSQGWGSVNAWVAYDATAEEWAAKAIARINATEQLWFEAIGTYESGINFYSVDSLPNTLLTGLGGTDPSPFRLGAEWTAGGLVGYQVNPRFKASVGAQYFNKVGHDFVSGIFGGDVDAIRAGATFDYEIVENFNTKLAVNYTTYDTPVGDYDQWSGFLRFDRNF